MSLFNNKTEPVLDATRFGLAGGILWGLFLLVFTFIAFFTGYWMTLMKAITYLYPGYKVTVFGAFIGLLWGFVDGFICGYLFAWIYNKLARWI